MACETACARCQAGADLGKVVQHGHNALQDMGILPVRLCANLLRRVSDRALGGALPWIH